MVGHPNLEGPTPDRQYNSVVPKRLITGIITALLVAGLAVGQTDYTTALLANPQDFTLVATFSVPEPANAYQHFFNEVKYFGLKPLSSEARSLRLNDKELRALLAVTTALTEKSKAILAIAKPITFETRIHVAGTGKVPPALEQEMAALESQWSAMVLDAVQQLQNTLPEPVFSKVDEFVRSGKSMFEVPMKKINPSEHP
ncbi:MAG: hypothetical protein JWN34_4749 [Bryobacterales bacterium]|nr:hypothetical protein [Bryobacterales bacterium]